MPMEDSKKTGPKDVFSHLLAIIFLYASVVGFGTLLFQYINIYFPDPLLWEYSRSSREALRWPIALLVIIFPLYIWLTSFLQRDIIRNPEKRELKTRRWLLYFTLFLTTIAIVIDLVTLIYRFLGGELTTRFVLKIVVVLAIAVAVFVYYLWTLRKDIPASKHPTMRFFVWGVMCLGAIAIVAGFFLAGSPQAERLRRFDDQRESDLRVIQYEIVNFWQAKRKLPAALDVLKNDINGFTPPRDPETSASYEYKISGDFSFELCATFNLSNKNTPQPPSAVPVGRYLDDMWLHDAGQVCFSRTIDPDLYPPLKKIQ